MKLNFRFKLKATLWLAIFLFSLLFQGKNANAQISDTLWTRMTEKSIVQLAFHPNSQLIATGTWDSYLSIWDISGNEITKLWGSRSNSGVEFSSDGKYLAYGGGELDEGSIKVVDCNTWGEVKKIVTPTNSLAFINDVNLIAIGGRKSITIWDFQTVELIKQINDIVSPDQQGSFYELFKMVYSPIINSIIYTATDGKLRFLNTQTYTVDYTYNAGYGELTISDDGKYIAFKTGLSGFAVQVMDIETKQIVQSIPGSPSGINSIAFSPDGKYLAVAYEYAQVLKIWDITTGANVYSYIENPKRYFNAIDWSSDNKFIAGGTPSRLFLYFNKLTSVTNTEDSYLKTIFPNPTDNTITLNFNLVHSENVFIELLNTNGQNVKALFNGFLESGQQEIKASIAELPQGSYIVNVYSKSFSKTFILMVVR